MRLIELCGCPGCGKTTLTNEIIRRLEETGKTAYAEKDIRPAARGRQMLRKAELLLMPRYGRLRSELIKYWANTQKNLHAFRYIIRVLEVAGYLKDSRQPDFLILDEGAIQHLTSISHGKEVQIPLSLAETVLETIYPAGNLVLDCILPYEEVRKRLAGRGRERDRFNSEDAGKTLKALKLKRENLDVVLDAVKPERVQIPMEDLNTAVREALTAINRGETDAE